MKRVLVGITVFALAAACGGATQSDVLGGGSTSSSGGSSGGSSSGGGGKTYEQITTCTRAGQCELGGTGCCGLSCNAGSNAVGILRGEAETLRQLTCAETGPVACPACEPARDPSTQAFCEGGKCVVVDITEHAISDCSSGGSGAGECELAWGECCPRCGTASGEMLVAVRKGNAAALRAQLCSGTEKCADCAGRFPAGYQAACGIDDHCAVVKR